MLDIQKKYIVDENNNRLAVETSGDTADDKAGNKFENWKSTFQFSNLFPGIR